MIRWCPSKHSVINGIIIHYLVKSDGMVYYGCDKVGECVNFDFVWQESSTSDLVFWTILLSFAEVQTDDSCCYFLLVRILIAALTFIMFNQSCVLNLIPFSFLVSFYHYLDLRRYVYLNRSITFSHYGQNQEFR
jgi:hypothetical protein